MSYVIGSFNLLDFNISMRNANDGEERKDFQKISKIIIEEKFDIVALQEINSLLALKYLVEQLNRMSCCQGMYDFSFGENMPCLNGNRHDPERYAFIWNMRRFRLVNVPNKQNPKYYPYGHGSRLIRPPYYGRFTARGLIGGSNFEIRLINTHIHSTNEKEKLEEFKILVTEILPRICDHQVLSVEGEFMPAYTFLLGDYNITLHKSEMAAYRIEDVIASGYTGKKRIYQTVQKEQTTLKKPGFQTNIDDCYHMDYDHFTYETDLNRKMIIIPERVEVLGKYFANTGNASQKLEMYRNTISDHVPIKLTIDLKPTIGGRYE